MKFLDYRVDFDILLWLKRLIFLLSISNFPFHLLFSNSADSVWSLQRAAHRLGIISKILFCN